MAKKKIAVILAGCGHRDGAEITEAASTLIALDKEGVEFSCFAPDITVPSVNHLTQAEDGTQNILVEAARIARGKISPLAELQESQFDALVMPGGSGAARHLSTWYTAGAKCTVNPDLEKTIKAFHAASKPIGAICVTPTIVARVLGSENITVTIGNNVEVAAEIKKTGAIHEECPVDDYVSDRLNKILSSPAYMYGDAKPYQIFTGISKLIRELVEMA